jgi:hypothetical protein
MAELNRFSKEIFSQMISPGMSLLKAHTIFWEYAKKLNDYLGNTANNVVKDFNELVEGGSNYVDWITEIDGRQLEISYSLAKDASLHKDNGYYVAIAISEGENNEAGIDQEITPETDPIPVLNRLLKEYIGAPKEDAQNLHLNVNQEVKNRIESLKPNTPPNVQMEVWEMIKAIPNSNQQKELEQLFKQKVKASNSRMTKLSRVIKKKGKWHVVSEKGKNLGGPYDTKEEAIERLQEVEYFKHHAKLSNEFHHTIWAFYQTQIARADLRNELKYNYGKILPEKVLNRVLIEHGQNIDEYRSEGGTNKVDDLMNWLGY